MGFTSAFDGYYKWLGIPPKGQPPNHYRLPDLLLAGCTLVN
jgi:hypothetical protein